MRFRSCQLISLILFGMGENVGLDEWLADAIILAMMQRMKDTAATVRAQAVVALERLQDPSDVNCKITNAYIFHMAHDPSPKVRKQTLRSLAHVQRTIPSIYERYLDSNKTVRQTALLVLSRIHIRSLKIIYRVNVLRQGLQDPSAIVRQCAEKVLLPSWFNCLGKDYIQLLHCLDHDTPGTIKTCQLVLNCLFSNETSEALVELMNSLQHNKVVPLDPDDKLCDEKVFLWCCIVRHLRQLGDDDQIDSILPELTPFCAYIRQSMLATKTSIKDPETSDDEDEKTVFLLLQLLEIAQGFDRADEIGRVNLYALVVDLLSSRQVSNEATPQLVELLVSIKPDVNSRLQRLAELISDMNYPLDQSQPQQPGLSTADMEVHLIDTTDPAVLTKCLVIVYEMMQSPSVEVFTPQLRTLMDDFVLKIYDTAQEVEVRVLCLKCIACFCLLEVDTAKERIKMFFTEIANGEGNSVVGVVCLTAIFDIYVYYGLHTFGIIDDLDAQYGKQAARNSTSGSDTSSPTVRRTNNVLHTLFNVFNDEDCPQLHPVAALGLCKLLYTGRVNSYMLVSRLLLLWFNPDVSVHMQQTLGDFFQDYPRHSAQGRHLMIQAFVPTMVALLEADISSPLASVDISNASALIIRLTKPGVNPNLEQMSAVV